MREMHQENGSGEDHTMGKLGDNLAESCKVTQTTEPHSSTTYMKSITIPMNQETAFTPQKKLRVVTIGAGYSGMIFAQKLQHKYEKEMNQLVEHMIFESKDQVGGTWAANTYPGVLCDVPSAIYAFPFDPSPEWSHFYSSGPEIEEYIEKTVKKWHLGRDVQFRTTVKDALWEEDQARWKLVVEHEGTERVEYADILVSARGFLSSWKWPSIPGLHEFKGHKVHSAAWEHDFEYSGKKIGVIGNGSSAIQILPEMAKLEGTQVTAFQRNPTWIVSRLTPAKLVGSTDPSFNPEYREEDKERFRNPEELKKYRKKIVGGANAIFKMFIKGSPEYKEMTDFGIKQMSEKLNNDPDLCEKMIPKWELGCRRLTPGNNYLETFTKPKVRLSQSQISHVSSKGIHTSDGEFHELDVIVCATGFDVSQVPSFPVTGRHGVTLASKWTPEPESYLSLAAPEMPNFFLFTGPNATVGHGSLIYSLDWTAEWIIQWIQKMAYENIASVTPKQDAVDEFARYGDQIHKTLTWTGRCKSWYKGNRVDGRVTATFPGSALLFQKLIEKIRPEDFEIKYRSKNRWGFMGNGFMKYESEEGADLAWYVEN